MRLRVKVLYENACEFGEMEELRQGPDPHNLRTVTSRAATLCEREEVKAYVASHLIHPSITIR